MASGSSGGRGGSRGGTKIKNRTAAQQRARARRFENGYRGLIL